MKIGLVLATEEEYNSALNGFKFQESKKTNDTFGTIIYKVGKHTLYIVRSGIGEIASSSITQFLITKYRVKLILNYGVCGALRNDVKINTVFLVNNVVHYDFDISLIDKIRPAQYEEFSSPDIPINNKYVRKIKRNFKDVQFVRCASGDKFIADEVLKNKLINEYGCDICDMESAGIVLTCYKNKVDLVSIKAVSDSGSGGEYEDNVIGASEAIFKFANKVLELL